MVTLLAAMLIFLDMIIYIIFFDVILSWLQLFGIRFRPRFIAAIIDPLYGFVKSVIPTTIGPIELVPIVVLFVIIFLQGLLFSLSPDLQQLYHDLRTSVGM